MKLGLVIAFLLCLCAPAGASEGNLSQITGVTGALLDGVDEIVVSPDGKHVYAMSYEADALVAYGRDALTGALTQIDCASETGNGGTCEDVSGLDFVDGLAISPDGAHLYTAGQNQDVVSVFARDASTGTISFSSCVSESGGSGCADGYALDGAVGIAVSGDGDNVYVAAYTSDSIAVFDRDETTGAITETACVSESGGAPCNDGRGLDGPYPGVLITPDGENVYVPSHDGDSVSILDRDTGSGALTPRDDTTGCLSLTGGECTQVAAFDRPNFIVSDPGGDDLYVVSSESSSLWHLDRADDGDLTAVECFAAGGGACTAARGLVGALALGISPDGASVYAAGTGDAMAVFDREADGGLAQKPGVNGCIAHSGDGISCTDGSALEDVRGRIAVSPDGKHVYAAASVSDAIAAFARTPNGRPFCAPLSAGAFKHDAILTFTLGCTDPDGDPFTFEIAGAPAHGTLGAIDQTTGKVVYTPAAGYVGADSFSYRAADAGGAGGPATIDFSFTNQAPACTDTAASVAAGGTVTIPIECTDGDGDALTLSVAAAPGSGTLGTPNPVDRTVSYTAAGAGGTVTFAIAAADRTGASATQTVTVTVAPPPVVAPAPTPSPTPVATPTPTPSAPVSVPVTQVATLPSPKRCVSRRRFRIKLRNIRGNKIVRAEIRIGRKTVRRVKGSALSLPIDLRGLPKGRWTVQIITTDSAGKRVVGKRTYRTCVSRRKA